MSRILAIDYGLKRCGIAVTDPLKIIAQGVTTVQTSTLMSFLDDYIQKEQVECIVVGLPKQMDNTPSEIEPHIAGFIKRFGAKYPAIPIKRVDERFTSKMSQQALITAGATKKTTKQQKFNRYHKRNNYFTNIFRTKTMIYPIVVAGHPVLKMKAQEIDKNFPDLDKLIEDMFETMYVSDGVGLAAPQIGKSIRLFVIDGKPAAEDNPELENFKKVFLNPYIIEESGEEWFFNEGCLSVPGIREDVQRKSIVKIKYFDENWQQHEDVFDGMAARIIQHEYDHLEGTLFTDRLSFLKRKMLRGKLSDISKGIVDVSYNIRTK